MTSLSSTTERDDTIDVLAQRCGRRAVAIARSMVGDAEAEDLVQEALVRTFERLDQLTTSSSLEAWFFKILARLCLDCLRRRKRWFGVVARWKSTPTLPPPGGEDNDRLLAAVAQLPDKQRLAIVLRYGGDFSVEEIASALEIGRATAKTHLIRGMKRLRTNMGASDE